MNNILINPKLIKKEELPLVVMADDRRGLLGFLIKSHTKGNWNHIMEMVEPGYFVSQDPQGYREVPVESYIKDFITLKFWDYSLITEAQKNLWRDIAQADLDAPWKMRSYDWLGIVGQALHLPWLQNPHKRFCSERVAEHLRYTLKMEIPKHPNPNGINEILKAIPEWSIKGYWFSD